MSLCCALAETTSLSLRAHPTVSVEQGGRRKIIKNKSMAVGRIARIFALLRYVVEMAIFSSYFSFFWGRVGDDFRAQECPRIIQASIWYSCIWREGD